MFPQVTTEYTLPQYARLLQSSPRGPIQYERSEEGDQFAVFSQHRLYR